MQESLTFFLIVASVRSDAVLFHGVVPILFELMDSK